jgi:hypothetical protein
MPRGGARLVIDGSEAPSGSPAVPRRGVVRPAAAAAFEAAAAAAAAAAVADAAHVRTLPSAVRQAT